MHTQPRNGPIEVIVRKRRRKRPLHARFLEKVTADGDCWRWTAACDPHGYGRFSVDCENVPAYRVAYCLFVGPIPEGADLDHLCRNPWCVNPGHLDPVSHSENVRRAGLAHTHCRRGLHEFTPENTIWKNGGRLCKACKNALQRELWARHKEEQRAYATA